MSKRDYYEILGVSKNATPQEIKKGYRQIAIKYHPDKNPDDKGAEENFKKAAEAYEILSDDNKKARYERQSTNHHGHAPLSSQTQAYQIDILVASRQTIKATKRSLLITP